LTLQETATAIRDSIREQVGVPVTVGIARTKTLAKLFSDSAKPFGARVALDKPEVDALLKTIPIQEISGIAGRRARKLEPWNIRTCLEFAKADRRLIRSLLTSSGETLWWELNGEPSMAIQVDRPRQQALSRGGSLWVATGRPVVLWAWLVRNLERLIAELEYHDVCTGRLTVWVAYTSGQAGLGRERLTVPTQRFDSLLEAARRCLRRAWIPRASATRMQVFAEDLSSKERVQYGLFDTPSESADGIAQVKRAVNERFGRPILRSGATLPIPHVYNDMANSYDICDIRGKFCF
jgi:DNA polymerase V